MLTENEKTDKYNNILQRFNFYFSGHDYISHSRVTLDDVHDSVLKVGIDMEAPEKHYACKARQFSINNFNYGINRKKIAKNNYRQGSRSVFDYTILHEYGFTDNEILLIKERLNGTPVTQSQFTWYEYYNYLNSVKSKILSHNES